MIHKYRPYIDLLDIMAALRPGLGRSEFEAAVAARVGVRYAIAFAYGHAGLIAALRALGLADADVVLPAYTCTVVADAVVTSGNRPLFVDIDLTDYNMCLEAVKAALTPQTRAIIATHMYGYPADVDAIRDGVGGGRALIVEDRALGLLTCTPGTVGLRGDIGLFSFGPVKHLFTVQGGVIATNSAEYYEKIRAYRDREMTHLPMALWAKRWLRLFLSAVPFERTLRKTVLHRARQTILAGRGGPGYDDLDDADLAPSLVARDYATAYTDFQARVGLSQLHKLDIVLDRRQKLVEFYDRELRDVPGLVPAPIVPGATYSHYTVRIRRRDEIGFSQQMRSKGIEVGQMYDHVLPFRERFRPYTKGTYPNTEQATREVVNLPLHPWLRIAEAKYVTQCVRQVLQQFSYPGE